jgi:DNA-binding NtrC family response regulator
MSGSNRIMVVDDEFDLLKVVVMYLKAWNFEVDGFNDPVEALRIFQKDPSLFSLILTDIRMPRMTGLELGQHITQIKPEMKIMLMTAFQVDTLDLDMLPLVKHWDIIEKPFRLKQICDGIKKQLHVML